MKQNIILRVCTHTDIFKDFFRSWIKFSGPQDIYELFSVYFHITINAKFWKKTKKI